MSELLRDEWLEEMFFLCSFKPQILRLSSEAEEYGTFERGMKVVLEGGTINKIGIEESEYTIIMDPAPFMDYNVDIARTWYKKNHPEYNFKENLIRLCDQLKHKKYGHHLYLGQDNKSIFDKRFKPLSYNP